MFFRQLKLLLWKNLIIRLRHFVRTIIEILWPILLFSILIAVRLSVPAARMQECHYPARALPSAGVFPWIQTMFCNMDNPCFNQQVASEKPGQINEPSTETSGLTGGIQGLIATINEETTIFDDTAGLNQDVTILMTLFNEITKPDSTVKTSVASLMGNSTTVRASLVEIGLSNDLASTILQSQVSYYQVNELLGNTEKRGLVCDSTSLETAITVQGPLDVNQTSADLCALNDGQLTATWDVLTSGTNLTKFIDNEAQDLLTQAGTNSGLNPADLAVFVTLRLPYLRNELQTIFTAVADVLSGINTSGNGTVDLLTIALGANLTSANGFQQFCGHPATTEEEESSTSGFAQDITTGMLNVISTLNDNSNSSSVFCSSLINTFETNENLSFAWAVFKPVLFGKIPFSPDTNVTRDIMSRANATFGAIADMEVLSRDWLETNGPSLYDYLENNPTIQFLRTVLETNLSSSNIISISDADREVLQALLSNNETSNQPGKATWKQVYRLLNVGVVLIQRMLSCMNLNKFEGFPDEPALVERSMDLLENNTFWAGVVFLSPTANDTELPKHIKYKIRQDVDDVMRTDFIKMYFWTPGPLVGISFMKYMIHGFVDLQDMMEQGITRAAADKYSNATTASTEFFGEVPTLGYYLQQMPYPCYTKDIYWSPGPNANSTSYPFYYYTGGFLFIQDMIERGIASIMAHPDEPPTSVDADFYLGAYLQEFPYPCYKHDLFLEYLSSMMSLMMTLAWIYSVCIIIKNIVYEKEERLKEFMKMMGLGNGVHWIAWFINSFYLMLISSILLILVLRVGLVLPYSNPFILLIWMLSFCLATIAECFLISCFFSKANLAAACGGIIYFMLYVPYNFAVTWEDSLSYGGKVGLSLFSTVAFGYGTAFVSKYEMTGQGIQFSNWNVNPVPGEQYTFLTSIIMMLVDAVIYFILTWYVENVYPGKYGIPRPPYFMFTSSYWCGTQSMKERSLVNPLYPKNSTSQAAIETEPQHLPLGVSVQNLTKIYSNGNKLAVDDLTLNFYEGQITSFLGHNGAGKTTTMSILCGLYTPTAGTAYIHGQDIKTDMDSIRTSLGMCPQHNVLFRDLTVEEHLNFYAGLRGLSEEVIHAGTEKMLIDVDLVHKRRDVVHDLSGGMKRKLSVAVAFTGDSKTIILDEPTAGVDPFARRGIWDLLVKYREGRTIILSTHHMDEADLLGDRIAIISQGHLKCCGSSLFLKSTYGIGYYLTLVKQKVGKKQLGSDEPALLAVPPPVDEESDVASEDEGFASRATSSKSSLAGDKTAAAKPYDSSLLTVKEAQEIIRNVVPNARIHEENIGEMTFILPYDAIQEGKYAGLFQLLDEHNIAYGLMDTSLEEIFLSVADHVDETAKTNNSGCCCLPRKRTHSTSSVSPIPQQKVKKSSPVQLTKVTKMDQDTSSAPVSEENGTIPPTETSSKAGNHAIQLEPLQEEEDEDLEEEAEDLGTTNGKGTYQLKGRTLITQQYVALLIKRFHHARRNRKGIFAQIILPSVFVLVALSLTLILPPYDGQPSLELQPWMYGDKLQTFFSNDNPSNPDSDAISDALVNSPGFGTRCVDGYKIKNYADLISGESVYLSCVPTEDDEWRVSSDSIKTLSQSTENPVYENCTCSSIDERVLLAECPNGAGGSATPYMRSNTTDTLYNMTERDVADWLVKTTDKFLEQRFGGVSVGEKYHTTLDKNAIYELIGILSGFNISAPDPQTVNMFFENMWRTENGQVWFDNNGFHAMPAYLNILSNGLLRSKLPSGANPSEYAITVYNHPLNYTKQQVSQAALAQTAIDTAIAIVVVFAMSFVPASFVIFLIDERVTKAKHLQFISGVNQSIYWIANYCWDMVNYLVPAVIVIIIFVCFQSQAYVSPRNLPCLICLLVLYGWSITPMMYPFCFVFDVSSTAYVVLTCINLFIGINTSIATLILDLLEDNPHLQEVSETLQSVFLIFPHFCMGRGLIDMAINQATADAYERFGVDAFVEPFSWDLAGKNLVAMAIEGFVFFGITLLIQYRFFVKPQVTNVPESLLPEANVDDDVLAEKMRIRKQDNSDDILRIENLSKVYSKVFSDRSLLAVDRLSVGVSGGECFGLLGVNGAGKTTTFKMLTGDITPTAGNATICGTSINEDIRAVQQNTGYCPQFDALNSHLTGFEHLQLYARLRGVPKEEIDEVARWGIVKLGLKQYADKPVGTYSGGNKRKLSAAIAFIGCPAIIFLDEPTAGMDPGARRFLWKRILEVIKSGDYNTNPRERCIVLTSHSMEECEALCTRLAIMVNGRFMCIGTPQHLKNKYGKGYTLMVRVGGMNPDLNKVQKFLLEAFVGATVKERHHNMIVLQLPLETVRLAEVFELIEDHKPHLEIEDYSVSQTTLDEVFVSFAKHQTDGMEGIQGSATNPITVGDHVEMTHVTTKNQVIV